MTKLIIQIPCFNEAETLPATLAELPRELAGVDRVEWLVVNDGSTDDTVAVAKAHGVDHVVDLPTNRGLARAFMAGIEGSLAAGADIIVNTDADNQYKAADIPRLIAPILGQHAEIVVGARPIGETAHFSAFKRLLQRWGSQMVRNLSGTQVPDAPSGFRAFSRQAAMQLNVFTNYTYTLETIILAGRRGIPITSVPIGTNGPTRPSRLIKSVPSYVLRSAVAILRIYMFYSPLKTFAVIGAVPFVAGFVLGLRWVWLNFEDPARTHVPSLILAAILLLMGFILWVLGLIGDLLAVNRKVLEDVQVKTRQMLHDRGTSEQ
jgi:glycosyltransferase involved in cell wall biosynthesis